MGATAAGSESQSQGDREEGAQRPQKGVCAEEECLDCEYADGQQGRAPATYTCCACVEPAQCKRHHLPVCACVQRLFIG